MTATETRRDTDCILENADLVLPGGVLEAGSLRIEEGRIAAVRGGTIDGHGRRIDGRRRTLLPGFIDLHSDAIEKQIQPRPGGTFPTEMALVELDKALAACGITLICHCLSFTDSRVDSIRGNERAAELVREVNRLAARLCIHTRVHARYEITDPSALPLLETLLGAGEIHVFSLMDHTPGQGQFTEVENFRMYYGGSRNLTGEQIDQLIEERTAARARLEMDAIARLTKTASDHGVPIASHDDDTPAKVAYMSELGVTISEFPVRLDAARAAREAGMHVLMGAPNLYRGASLTGNLGAREAVREGICDMLGSDYAPMTMLHAMHALVRTGLRPLHEAARLISLHPAEAAGIAGHTGSVEAGKAADLVLADLAGEVPRIARTLVGGRTVFAAE